MKPGYLASLLAVLAGLALPSAAHAQECSGDWWCESYLVYDADNDVVSGYSRTLDWYYNGDYLSAEGDLYDPNSSLVESVYQESYCWAEADVWASDTILGYYSLEGYHYWDVYLYEEDWWEWVELGWTQASVYSPAPPPTTSVVH